MNPELEQYIEQEILPRYEHFDAGHRTDHVRTVIEQSLALADRYGLDPDMAYTIAAYHDTGLVNGRERHHLDAGRILAEDPVLRRWFTEEQITTMREAVEDHRASSDHAPRTIYGRIVAEADRVIDPVTILRRTVQYSLANYPSLDREGHWARCMDHLRKKYAEGGYLRLWIAESENARRLEELRALIRDTQRIRQLFDETFDTESGA
ncbi:MAG TPA: HD domain-containing protein [Candidatus Alistipes intestinipullorum]|nr:HD domain-containing protein [Candidatus Alistipes intestinipullorum]